MDPRQKRRHVVASTYGFFGRKDTNKKNKTRTRERSRRRRKRIRRTTTRSRRTRTRKGGSRRRT